MSSSCRLLHCTRPELQGYEKACYDVPCLSVLCSGNGQECNCAGAASFWLTSAASGPFMPDLPCALGYRMQLLGGYSRSTFCSTLEGQLRSLPQRASIQAWHDEAAGEENSIPFVVMLRDNLQCLLDVQLLIWAAVAGWSGETSMVSLLTLSTCEHHLLLHPEARFCEHHILLHSIGRPCTELGPGRFSVSGALGVWPLQVTQPALQTW
jgi:hypothetical protein